MREAGADAEAEGVQRLKSEITILEENRPGLPRLLDANVGNSIRALEEGVGFQAEVDEHIVNVLQSLDRGPLREALSVASAAGGLAPRDRERFVAAGARLARRLYGMGLIERVGSEKRVMRP